MPHAVRSNHLRHLHPQPHPRTVTSHLRIPAIRRREKYHCRVGPACISLNYPPKWLIWVSPRPPGWMGSRSRQSAKIIIIHTARRLSRDLAVSVTAGRTTEAIGGRSVRLHILYRTGTAQACPQVQEVAIGRVMERRRVCGIASMVLVDMIDLLTHVSALEGDNGIISAAIANAAGQRPATPPKGRENISLLSQQSPNSATPKTQFTFTCDSDSSNKMVWPGQDVTAPYGTPTPKPHPLPYPSRGVPAQSSRAMPTHPTQGTQGLFNP